MVTSLLEGYLYLICTSLLRDSSRGKDSRLPIAKYYVTFIRKCSPGHTQGTIHNLSEVGGARATWLSPRPPFRKWSKFYPREHEIPFRFAIQRRADSCQLCFYFMGALRR